MLQPCGRRSRLSLTHTCCRGWAGAFLAMPASSAGCAARSLANEARDCPEPGRSSTGSAAARAAWREARAGIIDRRWVLSSRICEKDERSLSGRSHPKVPFCQIASKKRITAWTKPYVVIRDTRILPTDESRNSVVSKVRYDHPGHDVVLGSAKRPRPPD